MLPTRASTRRGDDAADGPSSVNTRREMPPGPFQPAAANTLKIQLRSLQDSEQVYRRQSVGDDENVVAEVDVENGAPGFGYSPRRVESVSSRGWPPLVEHHLISPGKLAIMHCGIGR
jgi:hypothetical protein